MYTTLIKLKELKPCKGGEIKLLKFLNKETVDNCKLEFSTILEAVGIKNAAWCLSVLSLKEVSMFNARIAELSLFIFEKQYPNDMRVREAIQGSKDYFNGIIGIEDLKKLKAAARAATWDAIIDAAESLVWDAAWVAACDAIRDTAGDATRGTARMATWGTARMTTWDTTWKKIEIIFKEEFC